MGLINSYKFSISVYMSLYGLYGNILTLSLSVSSCNSSVIFVETHDFVTFVTYIYIICILYFSYVYLCSAHFLFVAVIEWTMCVLLRSLQRGMSILSPHVRPIVIAYVF